MTNSILWLLRTYQKVNRSLIVMKFPFVRWSGCRSWPSCSEYTITALREDGLFRGLIKGFRRLAHCHPLTA